MKPEYFGKNEVVSAWGWEYVIRSWSFPEYKNKKVRVDIYSNADEVELFINNTSQGKKKVDQNLKVSFEVTYVEGIIEAVNYRNGERSESDKLESSDNPFGIKLTSENTFENKEIDELEYIKCEIVDNQGNIISYANNSVSIRVEGPGELVGIGTGNPISEEMYNGTIRYAYEGKLLVIVKRKGFEELKVTAISNNLEVGYISL